jgi:hypothetical protein
MPTSGTAECDGCVLADACWVATFIPIQGNGEEVRAKVNGAPIEAVKPGTSRIPSELACINTPMPRNVTGSAYAESAQVNAIPTRRSSLRISGLGGAGCQTDARNAAIGKQG